MRFVHLLEMFRVTSSHVPPAPSAGVSARGDRSGRSFIETFLQSFLQFSRPFLGACTKNASNPVRLTFSVKLFLLIFTPSTFFEVPRNRGENSTLLSSLHQQQGMGPSMAMEGATTARLFEAYVEHLLAPVLMPGRVVVMDNLGAHRPRRARQSIEDRDCELIYLPPYSSDLNPIEEAFSKIKHLLRKIGARTKEVLIEAMSGALAAVSAEDVRGFLVRHDYRAPAQQL